MEIESRLDDYLLIIRCFAGSVSMETKRVRGSVRPLISHEDFAYREKKHGLRSFKNIL